MSKETQELTRNPNLIAFQTNLLAEYREKNKTAKKGQTLFIGSSIMELFPSKNGKRRVKSSLRSIFTTVL